MSSMLVCDSKIAGFSLVLGPCQFYSHLSLQCQSKQTRRQHHSDNNSAWAGHKAAVENADTSTQPCNTHTHTHTAPAHTSVSRDSVRKWTDRDRNRARESSIPSNQKASQSWAMTSRPLLSSPLLSKPLFRPLRVSLPS